MKQSEAKHILMERISSEQLITASNMLKVIAHPCRMAIVDLIAERGQLTVQQTQEALGLEQAVASQHISLMENKGVLSSKKVGRNKFVALKFPKMRNIIKCLEDCCEKI